MRAVFEMTDELGAYVACQVEDEAGIMTSKIVSIDDFKRMISKTLHESFSVKSYSPILLGDNVLAYTGTNKEFTVIKYIGPKKWYLTYKREPVVINLPALVYEMTEQGVARIFVTKAKTFKTLNGDTTLYDFDFPNMFSRGSICYGSFKTRLIDYSEVDNYFNEIMAIPLSHDWTPSVVGDKYIISEEKKLFTLKQLTHGNNEPY